MDWVTLVVIGLLVFACLLAIYQSRKEGWGLNRKVGTIVFIGGVAIGLFLDELLPMGSSLLPWVELIGAAIILIGLVISWYW
ncbi:hypothetical protein [Halalkalicoccus subterraneus]|uniref:hypothetical protein n=1 Tax=Halalkalicoccus subterraneus TaxID=2675002 RepID=UPI000EFB04C2|nr:hypothetical protein [Halalkalicoccus subterraneus]